MFDYDHPDTGVHFQIFLNAPHENRAAEDDGLATLALNFARPSMFVNEAASIIQVLARALPLLVCDYQTETGWTPFDPEALIASYLDSTKRATPDLARNADDDFWGHHRRAPRALLNYAWEWSLKRAIKDARCKQDSRNIWVPLYEFVDIDGQLFSYVSWFDGVATLFPKTDLIGIARNEYPAKVPGFFSKKRPSLEFIPRASADAIMGDTYRPDPVWPDAVSPIIDGGRPGQERFLARAVGSDTVCDPIYVDADEYRMSTVKPFVRIKFHRILDHEYFAD